MEEREELSVLGLSTTVANERLIEQLEEIVGEFLVSVKAVTWRSFLSFIQTQEGAIAPLVVMFYVVATVLTSDMFLIGEAMLILPFHLLAWYISFRLPRAEQLRAIAKVQDCIQRFVSSDDAFTTGDLNGNSEVVPPSALCISVLRDRCWRQLPYNMVVEGDVFKLREAETFPCHAERLAIRPPYGAVPSGQTFRAGEAFGSGGALPAVESFRARSTACVPMVRKFLQSAQREGRTDTVFFELAALVRDRLKKVSCVAFLSSALACGLWLLQPAVKEQSLQWHLQRFLLPLRLIVCLLPLVPAILLQVTDIWGNARIQSLFQWHAGLSDEERIEGRKEIKSKEALKGLGSRLGSGKEWDRRSDAKSDEQSLGGEIDASRVPLHWQLRELLGILGQGLEGHANLMHTLNSTTVVCFCDREGLLTDTCTTVAELCLCSSKRHRKSSVFSEGGTHSTSEVHEEEACREPSRSSRSPKRDEAGAAAAAASGSGPTTGPPEREESEERERDDFQTVVLDVQADHSAPSGLRFEEADWRQYMSSLKPLGLCMGVSRQPRELFSQKEGAELFDLMAGDLLQAMHRGTYAAMHDCCCSLSQLIGFREDVVAGFNDVKFCMELCRPLKLQLPKQRSEVSVEQRMAEASPNTVATLAQPHMAWRAAPSPQSDLSEAMPSPKDMMPQLSFDEEADRREDEANFVPGGRTNFSQTLLAWFVEDPRDQSCKMFCKGKPKRLLPRCTHYFDGHEVLPLRDEDRQCLTRLVLQWKASGLTALAYSFRPLTSQAELEIPLQLDKNSFFCATEGEDGEYTVTQAGTVGREARDPCLGQAWKELQGEQVLLGMAGVKLSASVQMPSYAEALQSAGIRFQVYSAEGEKRTRTLGSQLGLETGWNCLISLEPSARQVKNMMGQVVLPSGISKIRRHTKEVDNVPLLVSLYSKATPWRARQMISIMQEHAECVTCVGSALRPNFEIFRQASLSVSVLVNSVPQCRKCFGRRAPREHRGDLLVKNMADRAEFQLSADLTSLPCALQARHSFSNGEQRTLEVLFNAIKEARRCVDCILMVLIHYLCGAVELAMVVALQAMLCLPPPLEGFHITALLLLFLPALSLCLLFNAASPQIMKELPLKKADEKTLAQPGRLMLLYASRSVPSALVVVVAFVQDLHRVFTWRLERVMSSPEAPNEALQKACRGFSWHFWFTGRWPPCVRELHQNSLDKEGVPWSPWSTVGDEGGRCAVSHAQQWCSLLFVIYLFVLSFTFLDRYDSLVTRGPLSNQVLYTVAILVFIIHSGISAGILYFECKEDFSEVLFPPWSHWLGYVLVWPLVAVLISEGAKRRDRKYHMHLQKTLRVLFNTRLGMWSPK